MHEYPSYVNTNRLLTRKLLNKQLICPKQLNPVCRSSLHWHHHDDDGGGDDGDDDDDGDGDGDGGGGGGGGDAKFYVRQPRLSDYLLHLHSYQPNQYRPLILNRD
ncbi:hypothetical protein Tco_1490774 [Tanacetum coccineum]